MVRDGKTAQCSVVDGGPVWTLVSGTVPIKVVVTGERTVLPVDSHRFDLFLVPVADGDFGHLGHVCDLALGLLFVTEQ